MPKEIKSDLVKDETIVLLHKFRILKTLSQDEIKRLLGEERSGYQKRIAKLVQYKAKEVVIKEGDFDSWIFWVVKGEYTVIKHNIIIATFNKPGEVFGEMSSLEDDCRSASVAAACDGVCLSIDLSIFDTLDDEQIKEKIRKGIHKLKSKRLSLTTEKLVTERQNLAEKEKNIQYEAKQLKKKEEKLNVMAKDLLDKEQKLATWEERLVEQESSMK